MTPEDRERDTYYPLEKLEKLEKLRLARLRAPSLSDIACARCWKPLKGHGPRHSLLGIARQKLAQWFRR